jgi:hypothetical protein
MMKKSIVKDQKKDRHSDKDTKKRKSIDADIPKLDVFNYDILINTEKDICAMCKNDHIFGLNMKNIMNQLNNYEDDDHYDPRNIKDADDVWVSRYSLQHKTRRIFIHLHCALASPQVYVEDNLWYNLQKEVYRSSSLICRDCNDRGATIGCYIRNCSYVLHVPCAMKKGFKVTTYNRTFICPEHDQIHIKQAKLKDKLVEHDITKGKELLPIHIIDLSNNHDTTSSSSSSLSLSSSSVVEAAAAAAFDHHNQSYTNISNNNSGNKKHPQQQYLSLPKGFNYISTNLDSNDCIINRRKVDLTDCCDCVNGLCVDTMKCACIQSGRNYNYDGSLIPGTSTTSNHRIVECNWKCACSMRYTYHTYHIKKINHTYHTIHTIIVLSLSF